MSKKRKISDIHSRPALPEGFIKKMESLWGADDCAFLVKALDEAPSVSIRINRNKVMDMEEFMKRFADFKPSPVEWCASGFYLDGRPDFIHDPLLHAGTYYVQEAASMIYENIIFDLIEKFIDRESGRSSKTLKVLDLCAAPGGKTTAILNGLVLSGMKYIVVANEYDNKRVKILRENLDKWGDPNVIITNSPTDSFSFLEDCFDIVAVDAPCSGEGMMRREDMARSQWSEGLVDQCSALQKEILGNAVKALKPGGFLIYSTCTFNERENEENVEWLRMTHDMEPLADPMRFMPHKMRCEGLYVGVMRKKGDLALNSSDFNKVLSVLKDAKIRIVSVGTEKTVLKGNIEIPSSRRVLSVDYDKSEFPLVDVNGQDALSYLRRQVITLPEETPLGYVAVSYKGYPLGLVKNIGSRANNLYPTEWRVLT